VCQRLYGAVPQATFIGELAQGSYAAAWVGIEPMTFWVARKAVTQALVPPNSITHVTGLYKP
jgi:hypothetical protein